MTTTTPTIAEQVLKTHRAALALASTLSAQGVEHSTALAVVATYLEKTRGFVLATPDLHHIAADAVAENY